jgi:hypothetical protein
LKTKRIWIVAKPMILSFENNIATKACKVLGENIAYHKKAI